MLKLLLIFLFNSCIVIGAAAQEKTPGTPCETALSIDGQFEKLTDEGQLNSIALTDLLNQAFTPRLKRFKDEILMIPVEDIRAAAARDPFPDIKQILSTGPSQRGLKLGFNAHYAGSIKGRYYSYPYTAFNYETMHKLARAVDIIQWLATRRARGILMVHNDAVIDGSKRLLEEHTYGQGQFDTHLRIAFTTLLQAAAQLTSDPIGKMDAEDILIATLTQTGKQQSLMSMYSLMLSPGLLGRNGNEVYFTNPLVRGPKGDLKFSNLFKHFLKTNRESFSKGDLRAPFEFGHGCPVAHCSGSQERSGLQYFLDAVLYVFNEIQ